MDVQGIRQLGKASAANAMHSSGERTNNPKCLPETHIPVLDKIVHWARANSEPPIKWLLGRESSGKSAIFQALAERCSAEGIFLASFCFSQRDPGRNHALPLFATIAYQVAKTFPDLRGIINRVVELDPLVLRQCPESQLTSLIIEPLQQFYQATERPTGSSDPYLIIIDGLDQCSDPEAQLNILNSISKALKECQFPLKFFITSRPEPYIVTEFNSETVKPILSSLFLDEFRQAGDDM